MWSNDVNNTGDNKMIAKNGEINLKRIHHVVIKSTEIGDNYKPRVL